MKNSSAKKCIVIVGPTASGKTGYSIHLAKKLNENCKKLSSLQFSNVEVISADSRQVYAVLDIGTGKVTLAEMQGIPHHMLDVADARADIYSAHQFATEARVKMEEIRARGNLPIICGGTGLYIDALFGRIELGDASCDDVLRAELENKNCKELFAMLESENPARAANIKSKGEQTNKVRLVRAIEVARYKIKDIGYTTAVVSESELLYPSSYILNRSVLWLGLRPTPTELRANIKNRLLERLEGGMLEEIKNLHGNGLSWERMDKLGLEYRYCALHLQGKLSYPDLATTLEQKIWQYAKRQINWWKRNPDIQWFSPSEYEQMDLAVTNFLSDAT
jgi:tRNA dimethylallyltransferase